MTVAKGKLFVEKSKLEEVFNLPEGVEIVSIQPCDKTKYGWEFLLVSSEETDVNGVAITGFQSGDISNYRRISLDIINNESKINIDNVSIKELYKK